MGHRLAPVLALLLLLPWCPGVRAAPDEAAPSIGALVESALGTDPDAVIRALKSLAERGAQRTDRWGADDIPLAAILTVLSRDHWSRASRGNEVRLQALESAAACGGPQALAAVERIADVPGPPAEVVARALTLGPRMRSIENLKGMLLYLIGSGAGVDKAWPPLGGKRFVLWLIAANLIDRRDESQVSILFSPGDGTRSLAKGGGAKAYLSVSKATLRDPKFDVGPLTSYLGRRNDEKEHMLTPSELSHDAPLLADLSFPDGVIFGYSSGAARWVSREELGIPVGVPIVVGDESPNEELRHFSDR